MDRRQEKRKPKTKLPVDYARVNEDVQAQIPLLRVAKGPHSSARTYYNLAPGKRGSLQTAQIMANLVREDTVKNKRLELIASNILTTSGLDSHSDPYEVADTVFRYVQRLAYIRDPAGSFDSVQSAEQVLREGKGDCDDLSVLLATLLAMVGFKPRFVLAKYKQETDGFDHVYVDLELARGRVALDPSSRKHGIGWESPKSLERVAYPIFNGKVVGLGDLAAKAWGLLRPLTAGRRRTVNGLSGCGCGDGLRSAVCGQSFNCGARGDATREAVKAETVGAVKTLSLPAILFGSGMIIVTLKVMDHATRAVFGGK